MLRHRAVAATTAVLVAVLLAASAASWLAIGNVRHSATRVETARAAVLRYDDVQHRVSGAAFAEASYRRSPSDRSRAGLQRALRAVEQTLRQLEQSPDPRDRAVGDQLVVLDARYATEVAAGLRAGSTPAGTTPDDRVAGPALDSMQELIDSAVAGHRADVRRARAAEHRNVDHLAVAVPLSLAAAVLAIGVCWTVMVLQHRKLRVRADEHEWAAHHDPLTGLANRTLMWQVLDTALAPARPDCALLLVDLDRFKDVNDTHGHAVGDALLVAAGETLRAAAGPDDLVARLGGDEFALLVRPAARAQVVAAQVRRDLAQPVLLGGSLALPCPATVGVALAMGAHDRVDLLRRADQDMYAGKPRRSQVPAPRSAPASRVS